MALVVWIRLLPLSLHKMDDLADSMTRRSVRSSITKTVVKRYPRSQWKTAIKRETETWIKANRQKFERQKVRMANRLKSDLQFTGKDGRDYTYLGALDSYTWLRTARNYLQHGTTCDAIVDGVCRDTFTNAPVGTRMIYNRSLHISSVVVLHRIMTFFNADYPLSATSYLVPVIIGMLGVFPAFGIGRRLGGIAGGVVAAVVIGVHPIFLIRSVGSDNDVWNVVLPLFMMWAAVEALVARHWARQGSYALLAAVVAGLHAGTWRGWFFTYAVLLAALLGNVIMQALRSGIQEGWARMWRSSQVRTALLVGVVFYVAAGIFTMVAGAEDSYFRIPLIVMRDALHLSGSAGPPGEIQLGFGPSILTTVGELKAFKLEGITKSMGGAYYFFGAMFGLILLVLPRGRWKISHAAVLAMGLLLYVYLLAWGGLSARVWISLLSLPLVAGLFLHLLDDDEEEEDDWDGRGPELIAVAWFLASIFVAHRGIRFSLMMTPAYGILFAVAAGRLARWISRSLSQFPQNSKIAGHAALGVLVGALLFQPIGQGYRLAYEYTPKMNDAWWDTLTKIRDSSAADAIVNTWWDYGYWIKYIAERRVTGDGGTLLSRVHHWIGRAFVASDERETIGVLRMLDCGADTPYERLKLKGFDALTAHEIVAKLVTLDKSSAAAYLDGRGFDAEERADLLSRTHCEPPETFFIITSEQLTTSSSWVHFGLWNFRREYLTKRARSSPQAEAVDEFVQRFGMSEEEARKFYDEARALRTQKKIESFIAPRLWRLTHQWFRCRPTRGSKQLKCNIGVNDKRLGKIIDSFTYNPSFPTAGTLRFRSSVDPNRYTRGTPGTIVLAGARRIVQRSIRGANHPDLAVMVDVPNRRILVGSLNVLTSTYTKLIFLGGRYSKYFQKFHDQTGYPGVRVVTWKVNWNGERKAGKP